MVRDAGPPRTTPDPETLLEVCSSRSFGVGSDLVGTSLRGGFDVEENFQAAAFISVKFRARHSKCWFQTGAFLQHSYSQGRVTKRP